MPAASRKSSSSHRSDHLESPRPTNWVDRLARLETHFGRFLWDILGVLLIAFALMTLLGILGLSKGTLLEKWVELLYLWLGWGELMVILFAGAGGVMAFRHSRRPFQIQWGRVIALEFAAFLTLAVLSTISGNRLAEGSMWGGRVGWGLAMLTVRYVGPIWGGVIVFVLWGVAILGAFGLWQLLETWLLQQAGTSPAPDLVSALPEVPYVSPLPTENPVVSANGNKKPAKKLPPEFRKSFKVSDRQDSHTTAPPPRGERLPPLNVLLGEQSVRPDERTINQTAGLIEKSLSEFGIPAKVVGFRIGPTVTQFAVQPGFIRKGNEVDAQQMKVRVAQIASLQKDLALALSAERLRIEAPVPGRGYVGIEVP
ncbi:MAG: DNA translocase FtsK, partial [Chloroflexota bacterium]